MDGIAAVTIKHQALEKKIFDFIAIILNDQSETITMRGMAASILLDFKEKRYQKSILNFVEEEAEFSEIDPSFFPFFGGDKE